MSCTIPQNASTRRAAKAPVGSYRHYAWLLVVSAFANTGCGGLYDMSMTIRAPRYGSDLPLSFSDIIVADDARWREHLGEFGYAIARDKVVHLNYKGQPKDAQAIVYIHGNSGSIDEICHAKVQGESDSPTLFDTLDKKYRVVAIDRPGHGYSDRSDANHPWQQVAVLRAALQKLNVKKPILVGHTWGGALALLYAIRWKDDVAGLVLLDPVVDGPAYTLLPAADVLALPTTRLGLLWISTTWLRPAVDQALREAYFGKGEPAKQGIPPRDSEYAGRAVDLWSRCSALVHAGIDDCNLKSELTRNPPDYRSIAAPIVILTSERDSDVKREQHAEKLLVMLGDKRVDLRRSLPCAKMITLTNASDVAEEIDRLATRIGAP